MAVFVFDGDDTLWMLEWQYARAAVQFFDFLYTTFRSRTPHLHYLKNRFYEIDGEHFKTWGVKQGRLTQTMLRVYEEVSEWAERRFGGQFSPTEVEWHKLTIRLLGDSPFDYKKLQWLPEARAVLQQLRSQNQELCFLSAYDADVFPGKAEFLKLTEFFSPNRIGITQFRKTKDDFIAVSGWTPEKDSLHLWFAVGNGESDIRPALEISENWRGIYVPHGSTSALFKQRESTQRFDPPPLNHPRVATIRSLKELTPNLIKKLTSAY